jgi:hypothetical protein
MANNAKATISRWPSLGSMTHALMIGRGTSAARAHKESGKSKQTQAAEAEATAASAAAEEREPNKDAEQAQKKKKKQKKQEGAGRRSGRQGKCGRGRQRCWSFVGGRYEGRRGWRPVQRDGLHGLAHGGAEGVGQRRRHG